MGFLKDILVQVKSAFNLKVLIALAIVCVIGAIFVYLNDNNQKKIYENSAYYRILKVPFERKITKSVEYLFYNAAAERGQILKYTKQDSNGLEYFSYKNSLFLFPDFDYISFDEYKKEFQANYSEKISVGEKKNINKLSLDEAYNRLVSKLDSNAPKLPIKILFEEFGVVFPEGGDEKLPDYIYLIDAFGTAMDREEIESV